MTDAWIAANAYIIAPSTLRRGTTDREPVGP